MLSLKCLEPIRYVIKDLFNYLCPENYTVYQFLLCPYQVVINGAMFVAGVTLEDAMLVLAGFSDFLDLSVNQTSNNKKVKAPTAHFMNFVRHYLLQVNTCIAPHLEATATFKRLSVVAMRLLLAKVKIPSPAGQAAPTTPGNSACTSQPVE